MFDAASVGAGRQILQQDGSVRPRGALSHRRAIGAHRRARKARPDAFEAEHIEQQLLAPDWPEGQVFATEAPNRGRDAFRMLVPEYYTAGCLTCHGEPKGEIDVTGYPKEGGKLGDLGGVISITLFR